MATLLFLDDVLRTKEYVPVTQGIKLYRTLNDKGRTLILCKSRAKDDNWLRQHKINLVDDLIAPDILTEGDDNVEWRLVEYCRTKGPVDMVVTGNPELASQLLSVGITTLLFLHPIYITEKFRPDSWQGIKSWTAISEELATQQEQYINDHRVAGWDA